MTASRMQAERARLRRTARRARLSLTPTERASASERITTHIAGSALWHASRRIGLYFGLQEEVDLSALFLRAWESRRCVYVPVVGRTGVMRFARLDPDTTLARNHYGIWEPQRPHGHVAARRLDLVVTPLVAFDDSGNRIGMGAGYYDRCFGFLLQRTRWLHPKLLGASFECQRVASIPAEVWDVPLHAVVTENGLQRIVH